MKRSVGSAANPKGHPAGDEPRDYHMSFDQYGHLMPGGLEEAAGAANA